MSVLAPGSFFTTLGVNLAPPKSIFFNDRLGVLFVRATSQDLDTIEKAIQALNMTPPQVHIKARFIEVGQDDSTALGFDWYLGQVNMGGGKVVGQRRHRAIAQRAGLSGQSDRCFPGYLPHSTGSTPRCPSRHRIN